MDFKLSAICMQSGTYMQHPKYFVDDSTLPSARMGDQMSYMHDNPCRSLTAVQLLSSDDNVHGSICSKTNHIILMFCVHPKTIHLKFYIRIQQSLSYGIYNY